MNDNPKLRTRRVLAFRVFFLVVALASAWIGALELSVRHACLFPTARTYRLRFAWDGSLTQFQVENPQVGTGPSERIYAVLRKEMETKIAVLLSEARLKAADGRISLSIAGCAEPYLIDWFDPEVPALSRFMEAAKLRNVNELRAALAAGMNSNARDFQGHTALLYAVSDPQKEFGDQSKLLGQLSARPDIAAVSLLIEAGANPNYKDPYGVTPLSLADANVAPILLKAGADVNVRGDRGETPLMLAARSDDLQLVEVYIRAGADVNAVDSDGRSALFYALDSKSLKILNALLSAGADRNKMNAEGESVVSIARKRSEREPDFHGVLRELQRR